MVSLVHRHGASNEVYSDVVRAAIQVLESRGEGGRPLSSSELDARTGRLGVELPSGLRALLAHFGNGCSGRCGSQSILSADELDRLSVLDGVEEPVAIEGRDPLSPGMVVAFTDEELDGSVWCLLSDEEEPVMVGRFIPSSAPPAIIHPISSFDAWLGLLVECDGGLVSAGAPRADDGDRTRTISLEG